MTRGDHLEWGFSIDSDGKQFNVTLAGSQKPDLKFDSFEALQAWMEDEWQGLQIKRMGRRGAPTVYEWKGGELTARPREPGDLMLTPGRVEFVDPSGKLHTIWHPCSFGCNEQVRATQCPIHGAPDA